MNNEHAEEEKMKKMRVVLFRLFTINTNPWGEGISGWSFLEDLDMLGYNSLFEALKEIFSYLKETRLIFGEMWGQG